MFQLLELMVVIALVAMSALFIRAQRIEKQETREETLYLLSRLKQEPVTPRTTDEVAPEYPTL